MLIVIKITLPHCRKQIELDLQVVQIKQMMFTVRESFQTTKKNQSDLTELALTPKHFQNKFNYESYLPCLPPYLPVCCL